MVAVLESSRSAGSMMSSPSSSPSRHITVVDVYDLAAAIGKDFERLIDQFGTECVRTLMPKVTQLSVFVVLMLFSNAVSSSTIHLFVMMIEHLCFRVCSVNQPFRSTFCSISLFF
jgi:hypothetical protein